MTRLSPRQLRRLVAADLEPVRPLPSATLRALWLTPIAVLVLAWAWSGFGVRGDAARLGPVLLWGASALQLVAGGALVALALRLAVPGEILGRRTAWLGLCLLATWLAGVNAAAWLASPMPVPPGREAFFWRICTSRELLMAAPLAIMAVALARRAFPLRPALTGALSGLGAGLVVDSGWRTVCSITAGGHILDAHLLPVALATALGALAGALTGRRRR